MLKPGAAGDLGRLLHLLNKELDIPGFGMDEEAEVVFYRIMIPAIDNRVDTKVITRYLGSIEGLCMNFSPVIATVAGGAATFNEVLKKIKSAQKKKP